jgi:hypothetical protein
MPVGTAIAIVDSTKNVRAGRHPDCEHVMRPDAHRDERDADGRADHDRVAEDRFAREHRDDFGREGECGEDQHVDFRMAENPEEVHPQHRGSARLCVEEMPTQVAIDEQHQLRGGQRAHRKNHQPGHDEVQP